MRRCYVGLVAAGVEEQAEDILVPPLLRNSLTLNDIFSPLQNSGPCNSSYCLGHFKNVYDDDDDVDRPPRHGQCGTFVGSRFDLPGGIVGDLARLRHNVSHWELLQYSFFLFVVFHSRLVYCVLCEDSARNYDDLTATVLFSIG